MTETHLTFKEETLVFYGFIFGAIVPTILIFALQNI